MYVNSGYIFDVSGPFWYYIWHKFQGFYGYQEPENVPTIIARKPGTGSVISKLESLELYYIIQALFSRFLF